MVDNGRHTPWGVVCGLVEGPQGDRNLIFQEESTVLPLTCGGLICRGRAVAEVAWKTVGRRWHNG